MVALFVALFFMLAYYIFIRFENRDNRTNNIYRKALLSTFYGVVFISMIITSGCSNLDVDFTVSNNLDEESSKDNTDLNIDGDFEVHFLDVGQADSILIKDGTSFMLIDGGNNDDSDLVVDYLTKQGVDRLDYIIGTHPHEDHIGGLDKVIDNFQIGKVIMPKVTHTSSTYKDVLTSISNKGLKISSPIVGEKFKLENSTIEILGPVGNSYDDLNNYSVVAKITFGNTSFLFTGDAEDISEKEMISEGVDIKSTLLKVGHHGSRYSSIPEFLNKVNPKYAIISVGKDNKYNHPNTEVLDRLKERDIIVYRTDEDGTIIATSDGEKISFNKNKSEAINNDDDNITLEENIYVDSNGKGLIKGNINSSGEKIYHMPDGQHYENTKPEAWFKTESEAKAAGFRPSKR